MRNSQRQIIDRLGDEGARMGVPERAYFRAIRCRTVLHWQNAVRDRHRWPAHRPGSCASAWINCGVLYESPLQPLSSRPAAFRDRDGLRAPSSFAPARSLGLPVGAEAGAFLFPGRRRGRTGAALQQHPPRIGNRHLVCVNVTGHGLEGRSTPPFRLAQGGLPMP